MSGSVAVVGAIVVAAVLFWATDTWDRHQARRAQDPVARARIRAGIIDWYSRDSKDARRETPRRRTGDGKQTPAPSFAGPTAARTEVTRGREQRIDGQVAPCPWAQRDPGSS